MRSLSQVYTALHQFNAKDAFAYPITVFSNQNIYTLEPYLRFFLSERQIDGQCKYGDYDNVLQECLKPTNSLLNSQTACVLLLLNPFKISSNLNESEILSYVMSCLEGIRKKTDALILLYSYNQIGYLIEGIRGEASPDGTNQKIRKLNSQIEKKLEDLQNIYQVNLDLCLMRVGEHDYYHAGMQQLFQNAFSLKGYEVIALETAKYIWAQQGKTKKCLVLDADNVLWEGIIGEDSWDKIVIDNTFQKTILALHEAGIILALCSKNNEADLWKFFETHTGMPLQPHHFSAYQINWDNKADNINKIAQALGISLSSIVFVDDSAYEIEWVRGHLPDVSTLHLPSKTTSLNTKLLLSSGYFDRLTLTNEDRQRGRLYQEQKQRASLFSSYETIEEFLLELNMELIIEKATPAELTRLVQLTQKTNQFNLTTRRYNEAQILKYILSDKFTVFYARLKDKFGDFGIIGLGILNDLEEDNAIIDTLLLSCRALGRGVEKCLLNVMMHEAFSQKKRVQADYLATPANQQTASFYETQGFTCIFQTATKSHYEINSQDYQYLWPDYYLNLNTPSLIKAREYDHAK